MRIDGVQGEKCSKNGKEERRIVQTMQGLLEIPAAEREELSGMEKHLLSAKRIVSLMGNQLDELLEYVRLEKGQISRREQCVGKKEFQGQAELLLEQFCRDKELSYRLDFDRMEDIAFMTDITMMMQLFYQLLKNAVQYTREGGYVTFEAYTKKKTKEEITNCFVISDNGIGMSRRFQKCMFLPFVREQNELSKETEGSGLGLYIVWQLVKLMKGEIQTDSAEERGTSVTVTITSPCGSIFHEGKRKMPDDLTLLRRKKILICEKDTAQSRETRKRLEEAGVVTDMAADGREAAKKFQGSGLYEYDAVLLHTKMQPVGSQETLMMIRGLDREDSYVVPVIALVDEHYDAWLPELLRSGMDAQLSEPLDMRELLEKLVVFWKKT